MSFFLLIFQSLSAQNSQRIDLSLKEQTLKVFLEIVEQKTNYTFMYNNLDLEQKHRFKLNKLLLMNC